MPTSGAPRSEADHFVYHGFGRDHEWNIPTGMEVRHIPMVWRQDSLVGEDHSTANVPRFKSSHSLTARRIRVIGTSVPREVATGIA